MGSQNLYLRPQTMFSKVLLLYPVLLLAFFNTKHLLIEAGWGFQDDETGTWGFQTEGTAEDCCKEDGITEENEGLCAYAFCVKLDDCLGATYDGFEEFKHALCRYMAILINTEEDYYDG